MLTYRHLGSGAEGVGSERDKRWPFRWGNPTAPAELAIELDLEVGSFKNDMPPQSLELGEKSPSSKCKLSR